MDYGNTNVGNFSASNVIEKLVSNLKGKSVGVVGIAKAKPLLCMQDICFTVYNHISKRIYLNKNKPSISYFRSLGQCDRQGIM